MDIQEVGIHNLTINSHQLQSSQSMMLQFEGKMFCRILIQQETKQMISFVEIREKYILGYQESKNYIIWALELTPSVSVDVDEQLILNPQNQLQNPQINSIKFRVEGLPLQICLFSHQLEELQLFHQILTGKAVLWANLQKNVKGRKKIFNTAKVAYFSVSSIANESQYLMKAFSKKSFQQQPQIKQNFINQLTILKSHNFSHVLDLRKVYSSANTIYMLYQHPDQWWYLMNSNHKHLTTQGKRVLAKQILKTLFNFHVRGIYHGNIHLQVIFFMKSQFPHLYELKLGGFDKCGYNHLQMMNDLLMLGNCLQQLLMDEPEEVQGQDLVHKLKSGLLTTSKALTHQYLQSTEETLIQII